MRFVIVSVLLFLIIALLQLSNDQLLVHSESLADLVSQLGSKLKTLSQAVGGQVDKTVDLLGAQRRMLEEFADAEARSMKKTTEEMIQARLG